MCFELYSINANIQYKQRLFTSYILSRETRGFTTSDIGHFLTADWSSFNLRSLIKNKTWFVSGQPCSLSYHGNETYSKPVHFLEPKNSAAAPPPKDVPGLKEQNIKHGWVPADDPARCPTSTGGSAPDRNAQQVVLPVLISI